MLLNLKIFLALKLIDLDEHFSSVEPTTPGNQLWYWVVLNINGNWLGKDQSVVSVLFCPMIQVQSNISLRPDKLHTCDIPCDIFWQEVLESSHECHLSLWPVLIFTQMSNWLVKSSISVTMTYLTRIVQIKVSRSVVELTLEGVWNAWPSFMWLHLDNKIYMVIKPSKMDKWIDEWERKRNGWVEFLSNPISC